MSLEKGQQECETRGQAEGTAHTEAGGSVVKDTGSCWTGSTVKRPRKWVEWGAKPGPCSRDGPHGEQVGPGLPLVPLTHPQGLAPCSGSGPGPGVYIELGSCWRWR